MSNDMESGAGLEIAIIGMSGRFPSAPDLDQFWRNLRAGADCITRFSDQELLANGVPQRLVSHPAFVKAHGMLGDIDCFDAALFGMAPREAELMDPQQRLFLECVWAGLENAGYVPGSLTGSVGVYAGMALSGYWMRNLLGHIASGAVDPLQSRLLNDKDYLVSHVAYRLDLRGPTVTVQAACATSLLAVHLACQGLLSGDCDLALAGGVHLAVPQQSGYVYQEHGILSSDGRCRPFDAGASGTVWGSGLGVVVLKRLPDALEDGDCIRAVIRGSATNNDGARKGSFTAPSIEAQAELLRQTLAVAEVEPDTISYVEAHGTGTALGDPIEISALQQVVGPGAGPETCVVGSVKSNIGHLVDAAGIAGLIKTVLALEHAEIPPTAHFQEPNPRIDFASGPFHVLRQPMPWNPQRGPRRALVTSLGMGGTNAQVLIEEAPQSARRPAPPPARPSSSPSLSSSPSPPSSSPPGRRWHLLPLSTRTAEQTRQASIRLAEHLEQHPDSHLVSSLADVAYTLQVGRRAFPHRLVAVVESASDAAHVLRASEPRRVLTGHAQPGERSVVFMFPGQGAQYPGMGSELYREEPVFRAEIDRCVALLRPHLDLDLRALMHSPDPGAAERLTQTALAQPALFTIEYALAKLWMSWGIQPRAMIGHSVGELVAACLAGVLSLEDALALVATRGALMQALPAGAMLAVRLSEAELIETVLTPQATAPAEAVPGRRPADSTEPAPAGAADSGVSLAAVNAPSLCTISGSHAAIDALERRLAERGVWYRRLVTSHAFHSAMVEPACAPFAERASRVTLSAPSIPYISNVSGTWIGDEAQDPSYWARHLRAPVRFAQGLRTILDEVRGAVLLEVGPGNTLTSLAKQQSAASPDRPAVPSMRHPLAAEPEGQLLHTALAKLWLAGVPVDWTSVHAGEQPRRVPLPAYPFERKRHWLQPVAGAISAPTSAPAGAASAFADEAGDSRHAAEELREPDTAADQPRAPGTAADETQNPPVAPEELSETEQIIAELWRELLGVTTLGRHDDFFELGGHSLLGLKLVSRLEETFQVKLQLEDLFKRTTIAALAEAIEAALIAAILEASGNDAQD